MDESDAPASAATTETRAAAKPARTLRPLVMIWRQALRYPRHLLIALFALMTTSAATLAIPARFKVIIDDAFGPGANIDAIGNSFRYLLMIVAVLGLATAARFFFVSWLGERVVADIRRMVQTNLLRMPPSFFEDNSPREISSRMTADTGLIEQVVGTTVSVALRNLITGIGGTIFLFALAPKLTAGLVLAIPLVNTPIIYF